MQTNPKVTNIAVPAAGAPPVRIQTTIQCSKVEIMEDPGLNAGVAQGLTGYYLDNANPPTNPPTKSNPNQQTWLPNSQGQTGRAFQPIIFGGADGRVHGGEGNYVGAQGTDLLLLNSASATATGILLVEWP